MLLTFVLRRLTFCKHECDDSQRPASRHEGENHPADRPREARRHCRACPAKPDGSWTADVTGTVVCSEQKQTGSWYAHSRSDKLWLDRVTLRKADGELITLNLDEFTRIEVLDDAKNCVASRTV